MSDVIFAIETSIVKDGRKLEALTPDKDGYYRGIPLMVLGNVVTRNKTCYDEKSFYDIINNPSSSFNMRLTSGDLFGEYGHPFVPNLDSKEGIIRILTLEPTRKAAHYKRIYGKKDEGLGLNIAYGDIKPAGPYGKYAEEMLVDPTMNFSTSLRAITSNKIDPVTKINYRKFITLITFDVGVPAGGYEIASKRYKDVSVENLSEIINLEFLLSLKSNTSIACETSLISDSELNEILQCSKIKIKSKADVIYLEKDNLIYDVEKNQKRSVLGTLLEK